MGISSHFCRWSVFSLINLMKREIESPDCWQFLALDAMTFSLVVNFTAHINLCSPYFEFPLFQIFFFFFWFLVFVLFFCFWYHASPADWNTSVSQELVTFCGVKENKEAIKTVFYSHQSHLGPPHIPRCCFLFYPWHGVALVSSKTLLWFRLEPFTLSQKFLFCIMEKQGRKLKAHIYWLCCTSEVQMTFHDVASLAMLSRVIFAERNCKDMNRWEFDLLCNKTSSRGHNSCFRSKDVCCRGGPLMDPGIFSLLPSLFTSLPLKKGAK